MEASREGIARPHGPENSCSGDGDEVFQYKGCGSSVGDDFSAEETGAYSVGAWGGGWYAWGFPRTYEAGIPVLGLVFREGEALRAHSEYIHV